MVSEEESRCIALNRALPQEALITHQYNIGYSLRLACKAGIKSSKLVVKQLMLLYAVHAIERETLFAYVQATDDLGQGNGSHIQ
jgi:hypothetical protein